jgi:hypothetical protein
MPLDPQAEALILRVERLILKHFVATRLLLEKRYVIF